MEQSENIADLGAALSKAQGMVEGAKKDSANPHFKSKYADLESTWAACRDAITGNGLAVLQSPGLTVDGVMHMTTLLTHSSGQWIRDTLSIPLQKVDAQGYGSAVTYARRYSLAAFMGVAPEDDDGNAAVRPTQGAVDNNRPAPAQRVPLSGPYTTKQEVKNQLGEFVRDMRGCSDSDMLDIVLSDYAPLINQMRKDEALQYWRNGDGGDFLGMEREIEEARKRVAEPIYEDSPGGIKGFDPKREDA